MSDEERNLAKIEAVEKELLNSARLRKFQEQVKKVNTHIDKDKIKRKYIEKHINMNKDELLSRLNIVDEIIDIINN